MPLLFKTDVSSEADVKVFVTDIRGEADLVVYETAEQWAATESWIWCYTDIRSEADKTMYFASDRWGAEMVIFKTDIQSDAGWTKEEKPGLL
jgi:hypothetical protein